MMLSSLTRRILGLDIGSHAVKAVEFRQTWTGFEVGQLREARLEPGGPPLTQVLQDLIRTHDLPTEYVVTGVSGDRISTRRLTFPFRGRKEVAQAVPYAVEEQVPFDLEDILVDWSAIATDRSQTEVVAALAPRAEVSRLLESLQAANLDPRVLEAEGLVLGNLALLVDLSGTRLLLDLGHRKTTLCLCVDGKPIAARTLPIAGKALTAAIAEDKGIGISQAERSKCENGIFQRGLQTDLKNALGVLDRLAREVVRTLGALEPVSADPASTRLEEIVICGGTAHLHRLDEYLAERTGIPTARLAFKPESEGSALLAGGDPLHFGPAIALALRGTSGARTHMDFRQGPFSYRRDMSELRGRLRPTLWLGAAVLALALLALATQVTLDRRRSNDLQEQAAALYTQAFPGQPAPANAVASMRQAVTKAHDRADFLGVYGGNLSALDLLTEISKLVPADLEMVLEELSIDRQVVRLRGHTKSFEAVDQLRSELASFESFSQIRVGEVQDDPRRGGKSFTVTISLGGGGSS